ncbi:elongation factor P [Planctomycetales bacterium ZRK34]|nr:elongation factor P [Planctomycetales bacterium ZRK34]
MAVHIDGTLFIITQFTHVTPGNLRAFVQVKLRNVITGLSIEKRLRAGEEIEQVNLDKRAMQYLYADGGGYVFMDNETYDQITLHTELLGDAMMYLKPNTDITVLVHDGRPVAIDLPNVVDLEVTETSPQPKGSTATNQLKEATLETGLNTRVPQFITIGEVIRVSTADGSYVSRAGA